MLITVVYEPDGELTEAGGKCGENAGDSSQSIGICSSSVLNSRIALQVCFCWHGHCKFCPMSYIDKRWLGGLILLLFATLPFTTMLAGSEGHSAVLDQPFTCGICSEFFLFNSHNALK